MAFKLTAEEKKELQDLRNEASKYWGEYVTALHNVHDAQEAYQEKRDAVIAKVEEIGGRFREEFNDKSEGWQQGDRGDQANEFIDYWEGLEVDPLDDPPNVSEGDPLDEAIDSLPEEL